MNAMPCKPGDVITGLTNDKLPEFCHLFSAEEIDAVDAALAAGRPLLVRGEPGIGKSQLARAAAVALKRAYVQYVVDVRAEPSDLLWHFDAVARLAEAQLGGALRDSSEAQLAQLRERLAVDRFVYPRVLWWAFDWKNARQQATKTRLSEPTLYDGCHPDNGCVALIDEIDKAEVDVPNGLLEALGLGRFSPPGLDAPVVIQGVQPLVIITTNEERVLPDAFLRRCMVLHLRLPEDDAGLQAHLIGRGKAHFPQQVELEEKRPKNKKEASWSLFEHAAQRLIQERKTADEHHWRPLPGQAEYLDLIRAVQTIAPDDLAKQEQVMARINRYVLRKHPEASR